MQGASRKQEIGIFEVKEMAKLRPFSVMFLFAAAACYGDPNCNSSPFTPSKLPLCRSAPKQPFDAAPFAKFLASSGLLNPFAPLNAAIAEARSRYWEVFPKGQRSAEYRQSQEYKDAEAAFVGGLRVKDIYNLMFSTMQGVTGDMQKMNEILNIDGGIPALAHKSAGMSGRSAERRGYGLVVFAAILLAVIGCFNLIYGIAAIANSHVFVANAHYVFGNLRAWGWITLIIGVVQLLAAAGVFTGNQLARWLGVAVLGLNAIDQMFFLPALPVLVADHHRHGRGVALWGLCAYGSRREHSRAL